MVGDVSNRQGDGESIPNMKAKEGTCADEGDTYTERRGGTHSPRGGDQGERTCKAALGGKQG